MTQYKDTSLKNLPTNGLKIICSKTSTREIEQNT